MKTTIHFTECEHGGDLDNYIDDLYKSGAKCGSTNIDHEAETGSVEVEIDNIPDFIEKFSKTDSVGFSSFKDGKFYSS